MPRGDPRPGGFPSPPRRTQASSPPSGPRRPLAYVRQRARVSVDAGAGRSCPRRRGRKRRTFTIEAQACRARGFEARSAGGAHLRAGGSGQGQVVTQVGRRERSQHAGAARSGSRGRPTGRRTGAVPARSHRQRWPHLRRWPGRRRGRHPHPATDTVGAAGSARGPHADPAGTPSATRASYRAQVPVPTRRPHPRPLRGLAKHISIPHRHAYPCARLSRVCEASPAGRRGR